MISNSAKRLTWPDTLKAFACFLVVCWHSSALAIAAVEFDTAIHAGWWPLVLLNGFCKFAVPIFLMVTGMFCWIQAVNTPRENSGRISYESLLFS